MSVSAVPLSFPHVLSVFLPPFPPSNLSLVVYVCVCVLVIWVWLPALFCWLMHTCDSLHVIIHCVLDILVLLSSRLTLVVITSWLPRDLFPCVFLQGCSLSVPCSGIISFTPPVKIVTASASETQDHLPATFHCVPRLKASDHLNSYVQSIDLH